MLEMIDAKVRIEDVRSVAKEGEKGVQTAIVKLEKWDHKRQVMKN